MRLPTARGGVSGLRLLATNETIPMPLDRFRNDPSALVQERALCGFFLGNVQSRTANDLRQE